MSQLSQDISTQGSAPSLGPAPGSTPGSAPGTVPVSPESVNLTLNHINKLLLGVTLAQSRGAYTFDDSVELAETVKLVTKFIKVNNDAAAKEQEQKQKQPQ